MCMLNIKFFIVIFLGESKEKLPPIAIKSKPSDIIRSTVCVSLHSQTNCYNYCSLQALVVDLDKRKFVKKVGHS